MQLMTVMQRCLSAFVLTVAVEVAAVSAQSCTATSGTAAQPLNVSAGATLAQNAYTLGARLGAAGNHAFGGVRVAGVTYKSEEFANAFIFGADFGWVVPIGATRAYILCPVLDYAYQAGPNSNDAGELIKLDSFHSLSPGLNVGRVVAVNPKVSLLPFVGGAVQWIRYERRLFGARNESFSRVGIVRVGLGVQFKRDFVIRATLGAPVGADTHQPTYTLGGTVSFASPRTRYTGQRK